MNRSELKQQAKDLLRNNWWMGAFYSFICVVIMLACIFAGGFLVAFCVDIIVTAFNGGVGSASDIAWAIGVFFGTLLGTIIALYFDAGLYFIMLEWVKNKQRPRHWFHLLVTPFTAGYFWLTLRVNTTPICLGFSLGPFLCSLRMGKGLCIFASTVNYARTR